LVWKRRYFWDSKEQEEKPKLRCSILFSAGSKSLGDSGQSLEFAFIKTHPATTNLSEVLQTN
jgi:hypothetical protein